MKVMISLLILGMLSSSALAKAEMLKVAVIDTGVDRNDKHLCKSEHKSFSSLETDPLQDNNGHGTHIAGLIEQYAKDKKYCIVAIKFHSPRASGKENTDNMIKAIHYAVAIHADFINISGGGGNSEREESRVIFMALNLGIKVVVAAGNERHDLSKDCNYFPACYDKRLIVVGNLKKHSDQTIDRAPSSNYGTQVNRWEIGTDVVSNLPGGKQGKMTGTSQATAIATGKLIFAASK